MEFYQHPRGWANRLIAGDSLLIMNSLLEKESMAGKVQMVYMDPPYGIKYGSNFQPFVDKRNVSDKDEDLSTEPEMIKAFRDTWELGIHSYLSYLRDRLLLVRDLLSESGSVFIQIGDENVHRVRQICDEVFGPENFMSQISFKTSPGDTTNYLPPCLDYIVWYVKDKQKTKFRKLYLPKQKGDVNASSFDWIELQDGTSRSLTIEEKKDPKSIPSGKLFRWADPCRKGTSESARFEFEFNGEVFKPAPGMTWKTTHEGLSRLEQAGRLGKKGSQLNYKRYIDDFPATELLNVWTDTMNSFMQRHYVVETNPLPVQRCILMTTDPGDLVMDITCGSGVTAFVSEKYGRRWITCDTSRIATILTRQRLLTATFPYYQLKDVSNGVSSGFEYKVIPHITLETLANGENPILETMYDEPLIDKTKIRVSGPFTMEAIPSPTVKPVDSLYDDLATSDTSSKQSEWRDQLKSTGIIARGGEIIKFSRVDPLVGTKFLQAEAETKDEVPRKAVICFANESAPLDSKTVASALDEAELIRPLPKLIIFCAFQFDPEAAKFIDETKWPNVQLLKVQMNTDLLIEDLMKRDPSSQSFWMIGQPDIICEKITVGDFAGKYQVSVRGFDYYDTKTGTIQSGDSSKIAMWLLDTDYDGMSLNPSQIFFPMSGSKEGWAKLAKTLRVELDPDLIKMYHGVKSIPFSSKANTKVAVKIIDNRGIESLKVLMIGE
jgi:adenine-specific DNA-methyltransferase